MKLFDNYSKNNLFLINRVVMAPMTRSRNKNGIYNSSNAQYYSQRAGENGAGLIITEATSISSTSIGMVYIPGIYSSEMVEGAKELTKAVHAKNAKIFAQIWHVGRISHTSLHPQGKAPKGASDIKGENTYAYGHLADGSVGYIPTSKPEALTTKEAEEVIQDFTTAAKNAIEAGFDGIELHGANGYLIEQFLNPKINNRTDKYGGSIANRVQFLLDIVDAVSQSIGAEKVGIRFSPYGSIQDIPKFVETEDTFELIGKELSKRNIAYVHLMDQVIKGQNSISLQFLKQFRLWYNGSIILAGGLSKHTSEKLIQENIIDLAAFGAPFISNPDLTYRLKNDYPLTEPQREYFFGGNEKGYTDYRTYK